MTERKRHLTDDQNRAILKELGQDGVALTVAVASAQAAHWPSHTLNDDLDISKDQQSAFHRLLEACEVHIGYRFTR
jgi:hypothetical protein